SEKRGATPRSPRTTRDPNRPEKRYSGRESANHLRRTFQERKTMLQTVTRRSAAIAAILAFTGVAGCQASRAEAAPIVPSVENDVPRATAPSQETAVFAGGCFWGIQAVFQHVKGVISATSGYAGGTTANPTYEEVGSGATGHAETVKVIF